MKDEEITALVDRFLAWPLPTSVCSDQCVTVAGDPLRSGTNLLTADEARQMIEYLFGSAILAAVAQRDQEWRKWWESAKDHPAICPRTYEHYHATPDRDRQ